MESIQNESHGGALEELFPGLHVLLINSNNQELVSEELLSQLAEFDVLNFASESATGSSEHVPPTQSKEDLRAGIERYKNELLVLKGEDGDLAGVLQIVERDKLSTGKDIHIMSIAVAPDFRRQGLGGKMLDWLEEEAGERNINTLTLRVDPKNHPALNLYFQRGYIVCGARKRVYDEKFNNVRTLALTKRLGITRIDPAGEQVRVDSSSYSEIDAYAVQGYRGFELDDQDPEKLVMYRVDGNVLDVYTHWS